MTGCLSDIAVAGFHGRLTIRQDCLFWTLLLQNTREGYFSDPQYGGNAGMQIWVYIGFPGARANYYEWVGPDKAYPLGPVDIAGERA